MSFVNQIGHIISHSATPMALVAIAQNCQSRFAPLTPNSIFYAGALGCTNGILLTIINRNSETKSERRFISGLSIALISGLFYGMFENQFLTKIDKLNLTKISLITSLVLACLLEPSKRKKEIIIVENRNLNQNTNSSSIPVEPQLTERQQRLEDLKSSLSQAKKKLKTAIETNAKYEAKYETLKQKISVLDNSDSPLEKIVTLFGGGEDFEKSSIECRTHLKILEGSLLEISRKKLKEARAKCDALVAQMKEIETVNIHGIDEVTKLAPQDEVADLAVKIRIPEDEKSDEKKDDASRRVHNANLNTHTGDPFAPREDIHTENV